jgi:hypothetical protein
VLPEAAIGKGALNRRDEKVRAKRPALNKVRRSFLYE